jgi:dTDP-4-amino-4,6-dideoxygalactose transaminase
MEVPLLDLQAQYATIRDQVKVAVNEVLESQRFILGPQGEALEAELAKLCSAAYAVAVASGSDALMLALKSLGIGSGDAVVTVPYTFFSTAGAIANLGARPLFVDIELSTFNMDPNQLAQLLERECSFNVTTKELIHRTSKARVKAVVPVHLYGQCADMDDILQISRRYWLPVVEDSCQALGARYRDHRAGTMGEAGCFSFFPTKNLGGAGEGGMVISGNKKIAQTVRQLRNHGAEPKYFHPMVGFNSRLDEIQAAVLRVKLERLEGWNRARRSNAEHYEESFSSQDCIEMITLPPRAPHRTHIYHQFVIRCRRRDELRTFLRSRSIGTEIYYPLPLHEQESFRYLGYAASDFPASREASQSTLALPIYPELTPEQQNHVIDSIAAFYRQ